MTDIVSHGNKGGLHKIFIYKHNFLVRILPLIKSNFIHNTMTDMVSHGNKEGLHNILICVT